MIFDSQATSKTWAHNPPTPPQIPSDPNPDPSTCLCPHPPNGFQCCLDLDSGDRNLSPKMLSKRRKKKTSSNKKDGREFKLMIPKNPDVYHFLIIFWYIFVDKEITCVYSPILGHRAGTSIGNSLGRTVLVPLVEQSLGSRNCKVCKGTVVGRNPAPLPSGKLT